MTNQTLPTEKHPFKPYNVGICKYLIIGSFPPVRLTKKIEENIKKRQLDKLYKNINKDNKDIGFYYGSSENLFWKILKEVFTTDLNTIDDIKRFLDDHNIGITDIAEEVYREPKNGKIGSADSDLEIIKSRNFTSIENNNNLQCIFTTSQFVTEKLKKLLSKKLQEKIITLLSPSGSASRSIGRKNDYKEYKKTHTGTKPPTVAFRIKKYREEFQKAKLLK